MKVHRVVLMVVDDDDVGADGVKSVLENQRYPNHCINPLVASCSTISVKWSDEHPLNREGWQQAFEKMFQDKP